MAEGEGDAVAEAEGDAVAEGGSSKQLQREGGRQACTAGSGGIVHICVGVVCGGGGDGANGGEKGLWVGVCLSVCACGCGRQRDLLLHAFLTYDLKLYAVLCCAMLAGRLIGTQSLLAVQEPQHK